MSLNPYSKELASEVGEPISAVRFVLRLGVRPEDVADVLDRGRYIDQLGRDRRSILSNVARAYRVVGGEMDEVDDLIDRARGIAERYSISLAKEPGILGTVAGLCRRGHSGVVHNYEDISGFSFGIQNPQP